MARRPSLPSILRHSKGYAFVRLNGNDHYLGSWPEGYRKPPESVHRKYEAIIAEWVAGGRRPLRTNVVTVDDVLVAFWDHAQVHYRGRDGVTTGEAENYRDACKPVHRLFGDLAADEFGPSKLKAIRQVLIDQGLARTTINARISRIRHVFKWAVAEEMVRADVWHGLQSVEALQPGRSKAIEPEPVLPVDDAVVEATLPYLPPVVADMVRLLRLTGMRPGEVCNLSAREVDRSGPVWVYRPSQHKKAWRGKDRSVCFGPRAQAVLAPYFQLPAREVDFIFQPIESEAKRKIIRRASRKSKVQPSQLDRSRPGAKSKGCRYTTRTLGKAVERAAATAGVPHWSPGQLRHTHATEVRRRYGLEGVASALGHDKPDTSAIYAERNLELASRIAMEMG